MPFPTCSRPAALGLLVLLAGCAGTPPAPVSALDVGELRPGSGYLNGYLSRAQIPDSLALLPPPPAQGSAAYAADVEAYRALTALQGGARGRQATRDADLQFPQAAGAFACALGVTISEQATPNLNMLLRRTLTDAGVVAYKAKEKYRRTRPFVAFDAPSCTPADEAMLRKDGSYPSGHAALGWAWALMLTELAPERTDALLQRGRSFGQSRGICGVHWKSDIEAGRLVGSATVARLHDSAVFRAQMAAARDELARQRTAGQVPSAADCAAEAASLSSSSDRAP